MALADLDPLRASRLACSDEPGYRADLARVSALVGCNPFVLGRILERVEQG